MGMSMKLFEVKNLHAVVENREVIKGVSLSVAPGEIHAIMGPNGSGKTSFVLTLLGHPNYKVIKGKIYLEGEDITELPPYERSRRGLLATFQNPPEIDGVRVGHLLSLISEKHKRGEQNLDLTKVMEKSRLGTNFYSRSVNVGFSGGERKRFEIACLLLSNPKVAILDEPDSGVDVDSLYVIVNGIRELRSNGTGIVVITHYRRVLKGINPDVVHILYDGKIVTSGDCELVKKIETKGYGAVIKNV